MRYFAAFSAPLLRILLPFGLLLALAGSSLTIYAQPGGKKNNRNQPPLRDTLREHIDELYLEGCTFMMQGESSSALAAFEDVLRLEPKNHASMFNIAQIYFERKNYDAAILQCKSAITLDPENYWYQHLLQQSYVAKGDLKGAIKVQEGMLNRFGNTPEELVAMAELQWLAGDAEKTRFFVQAAEQQRWGGDTEELLYRKIALYQKLKSWPKVVTLAEKLIYLDPENTDPYQIQYSAWQAQNLPDSALQVLHTLLRSDRNHPFALLTLANYWQTKGNVARADSFMTRFATAWPETPEALAWQSRTLKEQPANAASVAQARTLLAQNGRSLELWHLLLTDDLAHNDFALLHTDAETGLEYFPSDQRLLLAFGIGAARTGQPSEALFALEKVLKKADNPLELLARAASERALVLHQQGKTAESLIQAKAARDLIQQLPANSNELIPCQQLLETLNNSN